MVEVATVAGTSAAQAARAAWDDTTRWDGEPILTVGQLNGYRRAGTGQQPPLAGTIPASGRHQTPRRPGRR